MAETNFPDKPIVIINDSKDFLERMREYFDVLNINNIRMIYRMDKAIDILKKIPCSCVIVKITKDIILNKYFELLKEVIEDIPIIITYEDGFPFKGDDCQEIGAFECFPESEMRGKLNSTIKKALEKKELKEHNDILKEMVGKEINDEKITSFSSIITKKKDLLSIFSYLKSISKISSPILLISEKGSIGFKIARAIHDESENNGDFGSVNINELNEGHLGETLFGRENEDGTFKLGLFQQYNNGTIYIEEIDQLNKEYQNMLYRVFTERSFFSINSAKKQVTSARIIAGATRELHKKVQDGVFRRDLYYKLKSYEVVIPTLKERKADDLLLIVNYLLKQYSKKYNKEDPILDERTLKILYSYDYPGNLSELESVIEMGVSKYKTNGDFYHSIKKYIKDETGHELNKVHYNTEESESDKLIYIKTSHLPTINEVIKELINIALDRSGGRIKVAASMIGVTPDRFIKLMKFHNIKS